MTSQLVTRAEWGARPPKAPPSNNVSRGGITGHYGGGSPWGGRIRMAADHDHNRCATILRGWQNYHMDGHGWNDLAYNAAVCPGGVRFDGRGPGVRSAANGTNAGNQFGPAVVYLAGDGDDLTPEAIAAFMDEEARFALQLNRIHKDWLVTTGCPGSKFETAYRAGVFDGAVVLPPPPPVPPAGNVAPPFPLPAGWYFGPASGPSESVSGYFNRRSNGARGHDGLATWQAKMRSRGWTGVTADGLYDVADQRAAAAFQAEKHLQQDGGKIGPETWRSAWTAPIT